MQQIETLIETAAAKCGNQSRLAIEMNNSPKLISAWKRGQKTPSDETVGKLAAIAGYPAAPWIAAIAILKTGVDRSSEMADTILHNYLSDMSR